MPTKLVYRLQQFWGRVAFHKYLTVVAGPTKLAEICHIEIHTLTVLRYSETQPTAFVSDGVNIQMPIQRHATVILSF